MELEWTKTEDGNYTASGMEEDSEQEVRFIIRKDAKIPSRPWTLRASDQVFTEGLVGRQRTLKEAKRLAVIYCTRGLNIQPE